MSQESRKPANRVPRVRVTQDDDAEPVRVSVVEDDDPSLGLFAVMIFFATLVGTVLGLGADFSELVGSIQDIRDMVDPPPTLCIAGSDTILGAEGVGQDWAPAFEEQHRVNVRINSTGSVNGVNLAADGDCVHILAMSEPMTDEQYATLTGAGESLDCAAEVGYDIVAFVTNINNPLVSEGSSKRPVLIQEMTDVLDGDIKHWAELANWPSTTDEIERPITIWVRPGSGTTEVVLNRLPRFTPSPDIPFPPNANYVECASNLACLNRTLETPGSLYWVSVAWMQGQPEDYLRVISLLDGDEVSVNPLREEVDLEQYPAELVRPLYLYVLRDGNTDPAINDLAREFLSFARGIEGQQLLEERYFYNHFSRPVDIEVDFPEPYFNIPESGARTICKPS